MPFCIEPRFSPIGSYADALAKLNKNEGFTQRDARINAADAALPVDKQLYRHSERALDGKKRHMSVRRLHRATVNNIYSNYKRLIHEDERKMDHIAFTLHSTDVVTWREDDAVIIRSYGSLSTNIFASLLTPYTVCPSFELGRGMGARLSNKDHVVTWPLEMGDRVYRWDSNTPKRIYLMKRGFMLLRPTTVREDNGTESSNPQTFYVPDDEDVEMFDDVRVQPDKAAQARRKHKLTEFGQFLRAYIHMRLENKSLNYAWQYDNPRVYKLSTADWVVLLADPVMWPTVVENTHYWPSAYAAEGWGRYRRDYTPAERGAIHVDELIAAAKHAAYTHEHVYVVQQRMWMPSTQAADNVLHRERMYGEV